jgi:hypothetical protein
MRERAQRCGVRELDLAFHAKKSLQRSLCTSSYPRRRRSRSSATGGCANPPGSGELAGAGEQRRLRGGLALARGVRSSSRARSASRESRRASPPWRPPTTTRLPTGGGARGGIERVPKHRLVDLDRPADRGHGRRGQAGRRQLRRRLAGVDELADRAPDDRVRTAVVDVTGQREDVGDVGGGDEALACDLSESAPSRARCRPARTRSAGRSRPPRRALAERCR